MGIKRILFTMVAILLVNVGLVYNGYGEEKDFSEYSEVDIFAKEYLKNLLGGEYESAYNLMHPDAKENGSVESLQELVNIVKKHEDGKVVEMVNEDAMDLQAADVEMVAGRNVYSMTYKIPTSEDNPMKYIIQIVDDEKKYQVLYLNIKFGENTDQTGSGLSFLLNILFIPFVVYILVKCFKSNKAVKYKILWLLAIAFFTITWGDGSFGIGINFAISVSKNAIYFPAGAFLYLLNQKDGKKKEEEEKNPEEPKADEPKVDNTNDEG